MYKPTARTLSALAMGTLLALGAQAQQVTARVLSTTPILQQVPVNKQICTEQPVTVQGQKSGAGALMGSLAGGAIGNQIGDGTGRAVATMIGLVGGAVLGNNIEKDGPTETRMVQTCTQQTTYESRVSGYQVLYEYAGRQYSVQTPVDPGPNIQLQITPILAPQAAPVVMPSPVVVPAPVIAPHSYVSPAIITPSVRVGIPAGRVVVGVGPDRWDRRDRHDRDHRDHRDERRFGRDHDRDTVVTYQYSR
mgnify:CR=1 FL=1